MRSELGLHARPAGQFVVLASRFASEISVGRGEDWVDGRSVLSLLSLAASRGTKLRIRAVGPDAQAARRSPRPHSRRAAHPDAGPRRRPARGRGAPIESARRVLYGADSPRDSRGAPRCPPARCSRPNRSRWATRTRCATRSRTPILDAMLAQDPRSRVACETLTTTGLVMVAGEITSSAKVEITPLVRGVVEDIGYTDSSMGFDAATCAVTICARQAVARHRAGRDRGRRPAQGAGRRRPGDDVRLRLRRDARS